MWPTSMPREISSGRPQRGQGSPATTSDEVGELRRGVDVAAPVGVDEVGVGLVGAAGEVRQPCDREVGEEAQTAGRARPGRASPTGAPVAAPDLLLGRELQVLDVEGVQELDLVDLAVAADRRPRRSPLSVS